MERRMATVKTHPKKKKTPAQVSSGAPACHTKFQLLLAGDEGEFVGPDHLPMERAGNECSALRFAGLGISDGHAVDFQRASDGTLVVGFRFGQVGQSAKFRALCVDEVALRLNDEINGGCAELILFLFRVKRLLLELACFAGGIHLRAILGEGNVSIANIKQRGILQ